MIRLRISLFSFNLIIRFLHSLKFFFDLTFSSIFHVSYCCELGCTAAGKPTQLRPLAGGRIGLRSVAEQPSRLSASEAEGDCK